MSQRLGQEKFAVVGISMDDDVSALEGRVARQKLTFPQICDGKGPKTELALRYNADVGTHYVLDRKGRIAAKHYGSKGVERLSRVVDELLSE